MNMPEAIHAVTANPSLNFWARPVSWQGSGFGFRPDADSGLLRIETMVVGPVDNSAPIAAWQVSVADVCGEWEIVSADTLIQEVQKNDGHFG